MKFITSTERPTEGQYIEVWEHNGQIWSTVCRNTPNGRVEEYNPEADEYFENYFATDDYLDKVYFTLAADTHNLKVTEKMKTLNQLKEKLKNILEEVDEEIEKLIG